MAWEKDLPHFNSFLSFPSLLWDARCVVEETLQRDTVKLNRSLTKVQIRRTSLVRGPASDTGNENLRATAAE